MTMTNKKKKNPMVYVAAVVVEDDGMVFVEAALVLRPVQKGLALVAHRCCRRCCCNSKGIEEWELVVVVVMAVAADAIARREWHQISVRMESASALPTQQPMAFSVALLCLASSSSSSLEENVVAVVDVVGIG